MRFTIDQLSLVAAVLATVASGTPMSKKDSFTIQQVGTSSSSGRKNGAAARAFAYDRYHKSVSTELGKAASRHATNAMATKKTHKISQKPIIKAAHKIHSPTNTSGSGIVAADPTSGDNEYISPISIGGQTVNLQFDTGSSDLWVFSSELDTADIGNHSFYNASKSSTSKQLSGASWSITYGDGSSASGDVYTDTVNVGGAIVPAQAVETASNISSQFVGDYSSDGLLGLGFDSINTVSPTPQKTFFSNLKSSLASPLFTADLYHDGPGIYDFGKIDSTKYTGTISYVPVDSKDGFWGITSKSYGIGSSSNMVQKDIKAIVDTGTTLLLVPEDVLKAYYKDVTGAKNSSSDGGYTFPCDATLPDFYIGIGDYTAMVPASAINTGPASGNDCYGGIQYAGLSASGPAAIYGDVFLKSSFVVFQYPDGGSPTIGFAAKSSNATATTATLSSSPSSASSSAPTSTDGSSLDDSSDDGSDDGSNDAGDDSTDGDDDEDS